MTKAILFNKPYQVLSQFTDKQNRATLARYIEDKTVHVAGRLDYDSEGLLILTDSGELQHHLSHPSHKVTKTYWVQVEGEPTDADLNPLSKGVMLKDGPTLPGRAELLSSPHILWERTPPIRFRQSTPTSWLSLTIREGRNRQVRRMCAAIGFPVLRLIRYRVGSWTLDGIAPGNCRTIDLAPGLKHL